MTSRDLTHAREVERFLALGPLPPEDADEFSDEFEPALRAIAGPVSAEEARALVRSFGPDGAFGLAWSLLHLIETAPGWPIWDCLGDADNEWVARLRDRALRGGYTPP